MTHPRNGDSINLERFAKKWGGAAGGPGGLPHGLGIDNIAPDTLVRLG